MLFESGFFDGSNSKSYILTDPVDTIKVNRYLDVERAFKKIEEYSRKYYLAGYFSYELGYYFEKSSFKTRGKVPRRRGKVPYPLIHLCVFKKITTFDHKTLGGGKVPAFSGNDFRVDNLRLNFARSAYLRKISHIKRHIMNGDTYQANFTGKYLFDFSGDAFSFYRDLRERQNVPYGAFCKFGGKVLSEAQGGEEYVISLSPELFFRRDGSAIYSKPMKGTIERGKNIHEDKAKVSELKNSAKEAAGNLMIVDLIRNDLGKISKTGSVGVSSLFEVERYDTLFQMTSTIKSTLKKDITYFDIFRSLFPGGSVTGAPKIRTMQILKDLEDDDRNVYCGALGIIFPGNKAVFNLPIRTISITYGKGKVLSEAKGEMGVGGGITVDSDPEEEYRECLLKAKFLTERYKPFSLIETMRWEKRFKFLEEHLKRMKDSAEYFGFIFDRGKITAGLKGAGKKFKGTFPYRVRLLLSKDGNISVEGSKIAIRIKPKMELAAISGTRTDPGDLFLYHKTTNRGLYDSEYRRYRSKGYFDVIFLNTKGEVCEGAISNVIIKKGGRLYTPPLSSGLLPGIFRAHLLKIRRARERVIFLSDLLAADKVFLCNSVRGLVEVKLTSSRA